MDRSTRRLTTAGFALLAAAAAAAATTLTATQARAGSTAIALTTDNRLLRFDTDTPGTVTQDATVTGLQAGDSLLGIDFRPAKAGQLYGMGSTGRLYQIDRATGAATQVGSDTFAVGLEGLVFGFDFNPVPDRIRVVGELANQNLRLHPDLGTVVDFDPNTPGVQPDQNLAYAATDANAGAEPGVQAAAYLNPDNDAATGTTLYVIDSTLNILATQNPPNNGTLNTVGALGVTDLFVGFDIDAANTAFASTSAGDGDGHGAPPGPNDLSNLYTVNLTTGTATLVGSIGDGTTAVRGLAVAPVAIPLPAAALMFPAAAAVAGWYALRLRRKA